MKNTRNRVLREKKLYVSELDKDDEMLQIVNWMSDKLYLFHMYCYYIVF